MRSYFTINHFILKEKFRACTVTGYIAVCHGKYLLDFSWVFCRFKSW